MTTSHLAAHLAGADLITLLLGATLFSALAVYVVVTGRWVVREMVRATPPRPRHHQPTPRRLVVSSAGHAALLAPLAYLEPRSK